MLGELAAHFSRKFNGLVDLQGVPRISAQDGNLTDKNEPFEYKMPIGVAGRLFFIPSSDERYGLTPDSKWALYRTGHFYGDADYVEWLLKDPAFALVK